MNGLSWMIYLANIASGLSVFLGWLIAISIMLTILLTLTTLVANFAEGVNASNEFKRQSQKWATRFGILFLVFGTLETFTPNRQTVLLVAASEIGQRVMTSERMAQVENRVAGIVDPSLELLNTYISQQTQSIRQEMEKSTQPAKKPQ